MTLSVQHNTLTHHTMPVVRHYKECIDVLHRNRTIQVVLCDNMGFVLLLPDKLSHASFANHNDTSPFVQNRTGRHTHLCPPHIIFEEKYSSVQKIIAEQQNVVHVTISDLLYNMQQQGIGIHPNEYDLLTSQQHFSHCIIAEDNTSFHNWDVGLQFHSVKEISGKLFELRDFTFTSALPVGKDRTKCSNCVKRVLVLADIFEDSIRARDTLWHLARSLPTLLLSHGFKTIQTRCNCLLKGDLEWLWAFCTNLGRARQTRLAANPHTGKARTATQPDALAQKLARAGNFSKSCQAVCSDSTPSLGPNTLAKLQTKYPQGSVDFDKKIGPPPRIWMLYARKMIGSVSSKNAFLLITYANIMPVLPL